MATINRYRFKAAPKNWTDPGPDLLRPEANARQMLSAALGNKLLDGWYVRKNRNVVKGKWNGPLRRFEVMELFDSWGTQTVEFIVGREKPGKGPEALYVVRREVVKIDSISNCSPGTSLVHSLIHKQFPRIKLSGAYVYKQISGSSSWSDHAWGTAIDETESPPQPTNDETLDWVSRMGQSGLMDYDYALGSRNGRVVQASAPDFRVVSSSASSSHLWHVHISIVDHNGAKPPRSGGVW